MDSKGSVGSSERVFPPLYSSSGDTGQDRLAFFHILECLKTQKRTGWIVRGIADAESISDHMYRMAILAMCSSNLDIDSTKCVLMALVHDLAEAQVGDIAPHEGISKAEKNRLEAFSTVKEAMHNFVHVMLHGSPAALRIEALWNEYEEGKSAEARFVKDLDRFEMASQALEYERRHEDKDLSTFYESSVPKIQNDEVRAWGKDLMLEREALLRSRSDEQS